VARNTNIFISLLTVFLNYSAVLSWFFLLPLYLRHLGAKEEDIGLSYLVINGAFCVTQVLGGFMGDRVGRKKLFALPTFLFPAVYLVTAFAGSWPVVVAALGVCMALQGLQMPAMYSLVAESVDEKDRGLAFGLFNASAAASFVLGPGLGCLAGGSISGIRTMLIITACVALPCAVLRQVYLKDNFDHGAMNLKIREVFASFDRNVVMGLIAFIFYGFLINTTIYGPFITLFARDALKMNEQAIQLMFLLGGAASMFFNLLGGLVTRRFGARTAMMAGGLVHAFLFIPWIFAGSLPMAYGIFVVSYVFLQASFVAHDTILTGIAPIRTRSSTIGIINSTAGTLGAFAPWTGAALSVAFGPGAPFWGAVVFALLTSVYLAFVKAEKN
jgi:predicted MFS family arabinose efflux permease